MTPELDAAYAEPHRRYHGRGHIAACLASLDQQDGDHRRRAAASGLGDLVARRYL